LNLTMANLYYDTISSLEKQNISRGYINGWASGFLGNPKIEEQRLTEEWEAGYADGREKTTEQSANWKSAG